MALFLKYGYVMPDRLISRCIYTAIVQQEDIVGPPQHSLCFEQFNREEAKCCIYGTRLVKCSTVAAFSLVGILVILQIRHVGVHIQA